MNRRGFFSRFFSSDEIPRRIFFGLQIIINEYAKEDLRRELHNSIDINQRQLSPSEKKSYFKNISSIVEDNFFAAEYGFWDYKINSEATPEYNNWLTELTASIATEENEHGKEVDSINRISSEKNYIAVSFFFLVDGSKTNQPFYEVISSIKEDEYFEKKSFLSLISALRLIDFENTLGDAVILSPGNDEDGLSWIDIHSEGWNYLKPIL